MPRDTLSSMIRQISWGTLLCTALSSVGVAQNLVVDTTPSHVANSFSPIQALGAGVDRIEVGLADKMLVEPRLQQILSAGWQTVTYRQNTELSAEAWHWNPEGKWSDPAGRGYFVGNATPGAEMLRHSFGYTLPHRGFTRGGTDSHNYSRLTDGDPETYWKSNPYLARAFTGEDDALLPQWVVVDLGSLQKVGAIRIAWAEPHAKNYRVQFWTAGEASPGETLRRGFGKHFPRAWLRKEKVAIRPYG